MLSNMFSVPVIPIKALYLQILPLLPWLKYYNIQPFECQDEKGQLNKSTDGGALGRRELDKILLQMKKAGESLVDGGSEEKLELKLLGIGFSEKDIKRCGLVENYGRIITLREILIAEMINPEYIIRTVLPAIAGVSKNYDDFEEGIDYIEDLVIRNDDKYTEDINQLFITIIKERQPLFGSIKEFKERLGSNQETDKETISKSIETVEQKDNQDSGLATERNETLAYWIVMSIAVSSALFGLTIMVAAVAGYTALIPSSDKLILFFGHILLVVTGIIGIGLAVKGLYRFIKAKSAAKADKNAEQDNCLDDIEKLVNKINKNKADKETKEPVKWESAVKEFFIKMPYVILSLALLFGSSYALAFLFAYGLSPWVLTVVIFIGGVGVLSGLFYSVENIKALLGQDRPGFSFGISKEQIKTLEPKERLALVQLADRLYFKNHVQKIQPSFIGSIRNLGTLKGSILMAAGALIAYSFPGSDNWHILAGAIFGLILPYLVSVTYNFFCSYMNHYKFRSEFVKEYLKNKKAQEELRGKAEQLVSGNKFFFPFKNLWYGFSLRLPVAGSIIIFALGRAQMVFWGLVVSSALMPFIGFNNATTSLFEGALYLFGNVGWQSGFESTLKLMDLFINWHLTHTLGDFIRLSIIVYALRMPYLFSQMFKAPWHSLSFLIKWIFAPFSSWFWRDIFHLWIINAEIGAVLKGAEALAQHPQLDIIGNPLNNLAQSLEGQWGVISWGSFMLDDATQITGIDFSQEIHNRLGGKEDVNTWNKAHFLYHAMKFDPSVIGRMEINEPELELLLEEFKNKDTGFNIFNIPERNRWVREYSAFLLGEKGTEQTQEILIRILNDDEDIVVRRAAAASLGKFADYKAVEPLINNLQMDSSEENIMALMAIDDPRATRFFIQGLQNNEKIVRTVSALWLGQHGDSQIVPALIQALRQDKGWRFEIPNLEEDKSIEAIKEMSPAYAEAIVLAQINDPNSIEPLIRIVSYSVSQQVTEFSLDLLKKLQSNANSFKDLENKAGFWDCRSVAGTTLRLLQRIQTNKQLLEIGKNNNFISASQQAAALTLNASENLQGIQPPLGALVNIGPDWWPYPEPGIKKDNNTFSACNETAIISLNLLKDLEAIESNLNMVKKDAIYYPSSVQGAIIALGLLGDPRAINPLIGASKDSSPAIRKTAAYALGNFNTPEVKDALYLMLEDKDANVRLNAAASLAKIGETSKEAGSELIKDKGKAEETASIEDIKIKYYLASLKDGRPAIRYDALNSLRSIVADPIIREAFIDRLKYDNEPFIRRQAAISLAGIDDLEVTETLKFALNDPYPQVKAAAILSLAPKADYATMERIKPFLDDPSLEVSQSAVLSMGARLPDFPKNIDYLLPKLNSDRWQIRQTTFSVLGMNINKFPQLKEPFLNIAKDKTQPFIFQQSAVASLSKIQAPEIKDLLVSNLNHPDWRMRQTSAFGLGNFKDTDIIPSLKPLLNDNYWQVRQATVDTFSKFNEPQTIDLLVPKLNDPSWQVRQTAVTSLSNFNSLKAMDSLVPSLNDKHLEVRRATVLPIASNLKAFPELKQPLMNAFENKYEDKWVRSIAGTSLNNAGYSVDFDLQGIKPLEKSLVVFVPGVDDYLGLNPLTSRVDPGWSRKTTLGQDFYQLEAIGAVKIREFNWPGNLQDYPMAQEKFIDAAKYVYGQAKGENINSVTFIMHSAGNALSYEGINKLNDFAAKNKIKSNFLDLGSPALLSDIRYREIAEAGGGQHRNYWSPFDPISWSSAFGPNSQMILAAHNDYFDNLRVRQTGLSMSTGIDIPITYSRTAYGTISDQYFSATFKIQETKSIYSSGIISYRTQSWYSYSSGRGLTPSISPFSSPLQQPAYSRPTIPTRPIIPTRGR
jgi:HEAT repeat protein/uncharacterized membrane protein YidH (DUF202 family)